jgi:hypothetical protein
MAKIEIMSDCSTCGTTIKVDGQDITASELVTSFSMYCYAPCKDKMSGQVMEGFTSFNYEVSKDDGTIERKSITSCNCNAPEYESGLGQTESGDEDMGGEMMDSVKRPKDGKMVVRFLGRAVDQQVSQLVDKIVTHCTENKLVHADKEVLLNRTIDSLRDKATDLGITLEA